MDARSENTGNAEPFDDQVQRQRRRHPHGRVPRRATAPATSRTRSGSVTFAIDLPAGGSSCLPQSDEFDGAALDPKWTVTRAGRRRPDADRRQPGLPILQGDFIANDALASNTVLQDAPSGEWTATARLDTTAHQRQR